MKCPDCGEKLERKLYKNIEIDQCPKCSGKWFDYPELDQLEDTVFDQDELKNTMVTNIRLGKRKCPVCNKVMKTFNYRWENLELDMCPAKHGFWLDSGEEDRVLQLIENYKQNLERTNDAEDEWAQELKKLRSPSFLSKFMDLFR